MSRPQSEPKPKHRHKRISDTVRGAAHGGPSSHCAKMDRGKYCPVSGAHLTASCSCGAEGVWCPSVNRWYWGSK